MPADVNAILARLAEQFRQKPWDCPKCGKHFTRFQELQRHGEREHGIMGQGRRSGELGDLVAHYVNTISRPDTKGADGRYHCPECGQTFNEPRGLGRHRANAHGFVGRSQLETLRVEGIGNGQAPKGRPGRKPAGFDPSRIGFTVTGKGKKRGRRPRQISAITTPSEAASESAASPITAGAEASVHLVEARAPATDAPPDLLRFCPGCGFELYRLKAALSEGSAIVRCPDCGIVLNGVAHAIAADAQGIDPRHVDTLFRTLRSLPSGVIGRHP